MTSVRSAQSLLLNNWWPKLHLRLNHFSHSLKQCTLYQSVNPVTVCLFSQRTDYEDGDEEENNICQVELFYFYTSTCAETCDHSAQDWNTIDAKCQLLFLVEGKSKKGKSIMQSATEGGCEIKCFVDDCTRSIVLLLLLHRFLNPYFLRS